MVSITAWLAFFSSSTSFLSSSSNCSKDSIEANARAAGVTSMTLGSSITLRVCHFEECDAAELASQQFDSVVLINVLEHIADDVGALKAFEKIVVPGGTIANIGVHGLKVDLHLESLWDRNISITTRLVDTVTIPMLFKTVRSRKINPKLLITHRFKLDDILNAYETFANAAKTKALKVIIEA